MSVNFAEALSAQPHSSRASRKADNDERAKEILDFQRCGYDLTEYLEQQPDRKLTELN